MAYRCQLNPSHHGMRSDLLSLLTDMYELGGYSFYGVFRFEEGKKQCKKLLEEFQESASKAIPPPAVEDQVEPIPDFAKDASFGLMAKYRIAFDAATSAVLSESAFFSLAHVLEADTDHEASILLASSLYYKQALQMLRNYLEGMVLQLYFCHNQGDFEKWKIGDYRVPALRGKDGLLDFLSVNGVLPSDLSQIASNLYGELNGSIHGAEKQLVNRGLFQGKWTGQIFKYERFKEWCNYFANCTNIGIHTLRLSTNLWQSKRPKDKIYCDICHSENNFEVDKSLISEETVTFTCKICGSTMNIAADWAERNGY